MDFDDETKRTYDSQGMPLPVPKIDVGTIDFSCEVDPNAKRFDYGFKWSYSFTLIGGGFIEMDDPQEMVAPPMGYMQTVNRVFEAQTKDKPKWTRDDSPCYFVKFPSGYFGKIKLNVTVVNNPQEPDVIVSYTINPKQGSRYLVKPDTNQDPGL